MSKPLLYHIPPSFYSQIVRLALAEKGIDYDSVYVIPGPPSFETYAPWYMRLNPGGTAPTLVDEGRVLSDSLEILTHLEARFPTEGISETIADPGEIGRWVDRLYAVPVRELTYGSPALVKLGTFINNKRLKSLKQMQAKNPDLSAIYDAKIADIEMFSANANNEEHMQRIRATLESVLNQLDYALTVRPFVAGDGYSMADLVWTVGVARFVMFGMDPFENRPSLAEWYGRMKARPSFDAAMVMERFRFSAPVKVLWSKFKKRFSREGQSVAPAKELMDRG